MASSTTSSFGVTLGRISTAALAAFAVIIEALGIEIAVSNVITAGYTAGSLAVACGYVVATLGVALIVGRYQILRSGGMRSAIRAGAGWSLLVQVIFIPFVLVLFAM